MDQDKTIRWDITPEQVESQEILGFKVELSEDESHNRISFIHNTFNGADHFQYETSGGGFIPYPKEGISHPTIGREVKLPYESEKLMRFAVVSSDKDLYRISPDGERIIETLETSSSIKYLSIDEANNNIWITYQGTAAVVEIPLKKEKVRYIPVSQECLAVLPDGSRKVFWEVSENELILKRFNGQSVKSWTLDFKAESVLSYQILPATGNIYIAIKTSDPLASSERFLVFCKFAGDISQIDFPSLDKKIGCITKWSYNSVLTGGKGSELTQWIEEVPSPFVDLLSEGVKSVLSVSAKENDTIYLVNQHNYLMAFDSGTFLKQWRIRLPGSETTKIQPMFGGLKEGRPIVFSNSRYTGKARDFLTKAILNKVGIPYSSNSFSVFGSTNKTAIAYVRISATSPIPPESSSISSSSATSISTTSSSSSISSKSSSTISSSSPQSTSSTSFSESSISTKSSSTESSSISSSMSSSSVDDEWNITVINSSNARVDGYSGVDYDISIPTHFKNIPITSIGDNAFLGKLFTSISIPSSVTLIGSSSFRNCLNLNSITIPTSVTSIGQRAFEGCSGLSAITIPGSIQTVSISSFKNCTNITTLNLSEGIVTIDSEAFDGLSSLISVSIPESLAILNSGIFTNCPLLTEILVPVSNNFSSIDGVLFSKTQDKLYRYPQGKAGASYSIPGGVISFGYAAFYKCLGLTDITIPNGVTSLGGSLCYGCTNLLSITIPASVTQILDAAFYNCSSLSSISIPSGVVAINQSAFYNCSGLTSISIPSGITTIGQYTFYNCTGLTSLVLPSGITSIGDYAFYNLQIENFIIPSEVGYIGSYAFCKSKITSIFIPDNVVTIGSYAFLECENLIAIIVGSLNPNYSDDNGVLYNKLKTKIIAFPCGRNNDYSIYAGCTEIEKYAFAYSGLTEITIPNGMTKIGERAFETCLSLNTDVFIPASVSNIEDFAFHVCTNLPSITVDTSNLNYSDDGGILYNKAKTVLIRCPPAKTGSYTLPVTTTSIFNLAFHESKLTGTTLPSGLISIGSNSFNNSKLTTVTIPSSVTSIGGNAFVNCPDLTAIEVNPANATYSDIDGVLFNYNQTLLIQFPRGKSGAYVIPSSVLDIGSHAFYNCSGITSITFPYIGVDLESSSSYSIDQSSSSQSSEEYGIKTIGNYAFWNCDGITVIEIPSSVTNLGTNCFDNCSNLASVTFNGNAPTLADSYAFYLTPATIYYYEWGTGFDAAWAARAGRPVVLMFNSSSSSST